MTNLEKEHKKAIKHISRLKGREIKEAELTVKHGHKWDYEEETLKYGKRLEMLSGALMRLQDQSENVLYDLDGFYTRKIQHMIEVKNDPDLIMEQLRDYEALKDAIHTVRYCSKEVFEINTKADEIKIGVKRYIDWNNEKEQAESQAEREAAKS